MKLIFFVIRLSILVSWVDGQSAAVVDKVPTPSCDLVCSNGGYCALIEGTIEELARKVQSGYLIERCVCQPGYNGVGCETVVEHCSLSNRKCHNGAACTQYANGDWGCDCSQADSLSLFAGYQCRNPSTEYCSGKYDPTAALSFCTNGGRCVGDFLAAQVAPGDTSFNRAYQHRGCKCPPDFHGPHCEFLKIGGNEPMAVPATADDGKQENVRSPATAAVLTLMSISLLLLGFLIRKKVRAQRVPREIMISADGAGISWPSQSGGASYNDSRYNGRHIPSRHVNLRLDPVFEEGYMA